jgi:hypothetical protein
LQHPGGERGRKRRRWMRGSRGLYRRSLLGGVGRVYG